MLPAKSTNLYQQDYLRNVKTCMVQDVYVASIAHLCFLQFKMKGDSRCLTRILVPRIIKTVT